MARNTTTDTGWVLLLALSAGAAGAVATLLSRRRKYRQAAYQDHKADIKSWENEGGNLRPAKAA